MGGGSYLALEAWSGEEVSKCILQKYNMNKYDWVFKSVKQEIVGN